MKLQWQRELDIIAGAHGFTVAQLIEDRARCAERVEARRDCYKYLRARGWSLPKIGALFDRDHTTIIWALDENGTIQGRRDRRRQCVRAQPQETAL